MPNNEQLFDQALLGILMGQAREKCQKAYCPQSASANYIANLESFLVSAFARMPGIDQVHLIFRLRDFDTTAKGE